MGLYDLNLDEENPAGDPVVSTNKKKAFVDFYRPLGQSEVDLTRARDKYFKEQGTTKANQLEKVNVLERDRNQYPIGSDEYLNIDKDLQAAYEVLIGARTAERSVPDMSAGDTQRLTENEAFNAEYDYHPVKLSDDPIQNQQTIDSVMNIFDIEDEVKVGIRDHVGNVMHKLTPEQWDKSLGNKADECLFGMCSGSEYAPKWSKRMGGRPVTAQSNSEKWSGIRKSNTISDPASLYFYDYDDPTKTKHKTYTANP